MADHTSRGNIHQTMRTNPIKYNTYEKMNHRERKENTKHIYVTCVTRMNSKEERKENTSYQAVGIVCPTTRDCKTIDGGQHVGIYTFERIGKARLEFLYLPEKSNCIANKKK